MLNSHKALNHLHSFNTRAQSCPTSVGLRVVVSTGDVVLEMLREGWVGNVPGLEQLEIGSRQLSFD